MNKHSQYNRIV